MNYAVVSCTNRSKPNSRIIAEHYVKLLEEKVSSLELIDLRDLPKDFVFSALYDNAQKNPEFNQMQSSVDKADKLVFVIPEYNGSFPGVFKAFIDGLEYPGSFKNKKAALVGHSSGTQGSALALSHATDILNYMGMNVLAFKPRLFNIEKNLSSDMKLSDEYAGFLEQQVDLLLDF